MSIKALRAIAFAAALVVAPCCWGQSSRTGSGGGFGASGSTGFGQSSGGFGTSGFGSSGSSLSGFGSSGFGQSGGLGQSGFGQSGFGQSGFGQSGLGQSGAGGQGAFIGRSGDSMQSLMQSMGQGANNFLNRFENTVNSALNRGDANNAEQPRPQVRVKLNVAFTTPASAMPAADMVVGEVSERYELRGLDGANVELTDRTAVLTGEVATADERLLAEKMLAIEPGVSQVVNQLTVRGEAEAVPAPGAE
ncbi:BON domain-containing protein [Pseudobythopirellula maris]|nr:BON domain-containing protein [Pseudobythopirellula maris]